MRIVLLFCGLLIFACGGVDREIVGDEQELYQNHLLLKSYFYHPERIKEYGEYVGMEVDSMYESLKDYFCGAHYVGRPEDCPARYTLYYPPAKADDKIDKIKNTERYYSFGFERDANELGDTMVVWWVYPISPAADAGLRKKDKLLFANEKPLTGLDSAKLVAYLKDDDLFENSTVFKVLRDGDTITLPAMQKKEVSDPTVFLDSVENIPYIRVYTFKVSSNNPGGTYYEFKEILNEIKGAKVAIMDLRSNGGGDIGHCSAMASELVPLNTLLLYDEEHYRDSKRGNVVEKIPYYARNYLREEGEGVNIKWIILINKGSASCSERLLAAVKYNRPETVVIGDTSYGKGIGQMYTKTYLGGLAYITCFQTYYPNGETFHNIGILPDVPVPTKDLYGEIIKAAQGFGFVLAKRSPKAAISKPLPPERKRANKWEPAAYKGIELFHQGE